MTDLAKHLFETGVAMNRVAAEQLAKDAESASLEELEAAVAIMGRLTAEHHVNDPWWCPPEVVESLLRYWHHRVPTGGFLRAVLENNFMDAVGRADGTNVRHLPGIARLIHEQLPVAAYGSAKKVSDWIARKDVKKDPPEEAR